MIKHLTAALALAAFAPGRPWEQLAAEPAKRTLSHQLPDLPADEGGQDPETLASIFPPNRKAG